MKYHDDSKDTELVTQETLLADAPVKKRFRLNLKNKGKKFWVVAITVVLVVVSAGTVMTIRSRMTSVQAETVVQSAEAATGSLNQTVVGSGSLTTAESSSVKIPEGVQMDTVLVQEGDAVTAGQELATVNAASAATALLNVRESIEAVEDKIDALGDISDTTSEAYLKSVIYEADLADLSTAEAKLETMLSTGKITAESDGIISAVNVTDGLAVSSQSEGSSSGGEEESTSKTASEAGAYSYSLMTDEEQDNTAGTLSEGQIQATSIVDCSNLQVEAPQTGKVPQSTVAYTDGEEQNYTGTISWDCTGQTFQESTIYTATILLTAKEGYEFSNDILVQMGNATLTAWEVFGSGEGNKLRVVASFAKTAEKQNESTGNTSGSAYNNSSSGSTSALGSSAGSSSGGSSSADSSASDSLSASADTESAAEATVFSIAAADKADVEVSVDESDISNIKEGQTADITLDAVSDQSYEGTVTNVQAIGTSNGGSTKYTVTVTLSKTEDMLFGMTASATINVEEADNAILIPVSALQEKDGKTYVYTKKDSEDNLSGETEVETGLSDGSQVEIISGLSKGDTVYYTRTGSSGSDSKTSGQSGMMGGKGSSSSDMQMQGGSSGSERPSMPSGEAGGQQAPSSK